MGKRLSEPSKSMLLTRPSLSLGTSSCSRVTQIVCNVPVPKPYRTPATYVLLCAAPSFVAPVYPTGTFMFA